MDMDGGHSVQCYVYVLWGCGNYMIIEFSLNCMYCCKWYDVVKLTNSSLEDKPQTANNKTDDRIYHHITINQKPQRDYVQ
jgi:uncharacterized protein YodC (DUF2158 family)